MSLSEEQLLKSWKKFFGTGTNWQDPVPNGTHDDYLQITDAQHLSNFMKNPVHYLEKFGKGFFVKREGCALALAVELAPVVGEPAFAEQMGDIIEYRAMDYYQRRYRDRAAETIELPIVEYDSGR